MSTIDEDLLFDCVRRALDDLESGRRPDLAALCGDDPELRRAVGEIVGLRADLAELGDAANHADPDAGRVLAGRYRLEAVLGRGAMGVVHRGRDLELDREVAVKTFARPGGIAPDAEHVARFRREARVLAALRHPHIVTLHDRGQDADGRMFLVMELCGGLSLAELAAHHEEPDPAARGDASGFAAWLGRELGAGAPVVVEAEWTRAVARWMTQVTDALDAAHGAGVLHRDVKPSNVMVLPDGGARLLDFGIATRAGDPALTAAASTLGTPWYMAPEQARGSADLGPSVDVYGAAASLYHLLTGRPPFDGDAARVVARLLTEEPVPPHRLRPELPRDLCAIVEKGMEPDPARRYPSARAFGDDLRAFLAHRPTTARPLGRAGRALRHARRHPLRTALAVVATLLVAVTTIAAPLWLERDARRRDDEFVALRRSLPALLAIEGDPRQRLLEDLGERGAALGVLDRMLALRADDLPTRLWRAALRLDQGDHGGAAADLDALAAHAGASAYTAALAARYRAAITALRGVEAIDLAGLPAPRTAVDHYVAGFHELRNRHVSGFAERSLAHLTTAAEAGYEPAEELRTLPLLYRGDRRQSPELLDEARRIAIRLEERYGGATARTAFVRGTALLALKRYHEAIGPLRESIALRPGRHGPHQNLGVALLRTGDPEAALVEFERAFAIRPHLQNTWTMTTKALATLGRFDDALAFCDRLVDDGSGDLAWQGPEARATVHTARAEHCWASGDRDRAHAELETAAGLLETAADACPVESRAARMRRQAAARRALAAATVRPFLDFVRGQLATPDQAYDIANLESFLPETPTAQDLWVLRIWLLRLVQELPDADPGLIERVEARIQNLQTAPPR